MSIFYMPSVNLDCLILTMVFDIHYNDTVIKKHSKAFVSYADKENNDSYWANSPDCLAQLSTLILMKI